MPNKQIAQGRPKYPIPGVAAFFLTGLILVMGLLAIIWYVNRFASEFDYEDQDMAFLERIVLSSAPHKADFSALNGGDWQVLCLIGWQGDLGAALKAAKVPDSPARSLLERGARAVAEIAESEFLLVYANGKGRTMLLRHPHGFAFAHRRSAACITRGQPVLAIPVRQ